MSGQKTIIFDFDGTLANSVDLIFDLYNEHATEFGYDPVESPVTIRDIQSTILNVMGLDPYRFSYLYQGLNNRLIGPANEGKVLSEILF